MSHGPSVPRILVESEEGSEAHATHHDFEASSSPRSAFTQVRIGTTFLCSNCNVSAKKWPEQTLEQALNLHQSLSIGDRDWHRFKSDADRRGAELLAAALAQLLQNGRNDDVEALTQQALGWIRGELKDPGCPHH